MRKKVPTFAVAKLSVHHFDAQALALSFLKQVCLKNIAKINVKREECKYFRKKINEIRLFGMIPNNKAGFYLIINQLKQYNMEQGQIKLSQLLEHLNLSAKKLAESIGVSPTTIASIQSGQTKNISIGVATQICAVYKNINPDWMLDKSDQMLIELTPDMNPYYTAFTIQGGIGQGFGDEKAMKPDGYMVVPGIKPSPEIQFFQVRGDSMVAPDNPSVSIPMGAWVAVTEAKTSEPDWGHIYAIMTLDGPIVKILMPSDKGEDYIKVVSQNGEKYPPRNLHKSEIVGDMRKVVGVVDVRTL